MFMLRLVAKNKQTTNRLLHKQTCKKLVINPTVGGHFNTKKIWVLDGENISDKDHIENTRYQIYNIYIVAISKLEFITLVFSLYNIVAVLNY